MALYQNKRFTTDDPTRSGLREMALMHVFRDSARRHDSRTPNHQTREGEHDLTVSSQKRREGISEAALRRDLAVDLASLLNTIQLGVVVDLSDTPRVASSVVNYGLQDMDTLWRDHRTPIQLAAAIRHSLLTNEPRLRADTLEVRIDESGATTDQRIKFEVHAEMISNPTDIALEFFAEVDPAAGKIALGRIKGD